MPLKVSIVGVAPAHRAPNPAESLVLRALELVSGSRVELVGTREADLVLLYPYRFPFGSGAAGALLESAVRRLRFPAKDRRADVVLRKAFGLASHTNLIAISHENLDRRPWQALGNFIVQTDIPRLTSWPTEVDPRGFRLPYWWNYVDWPEIPRTSNSFSTRVGPYYDLSSLLTNQLFNDDHSRRKNRAVWITNHLDFPRKEILQRMQKHFRVDVVNNVPWGKKLELLQQYKYCVTSENSPGYGYESEKVPEARIAGCIPIGYIANPFSDFNVQAYFFDPPVGEIEILPPLLHERPQISGLLDYLAKVID